MKAELYDKWLTALRSGEWDQTTGWLISKGRRTCPDGYCCMGVLARCSGLRDEDLNDMGSLTDLRANADDELLGGLTFKEERTLTSLNDAQRKTFIEIASWIEKNIKREE